MPACTELMFRIDHFKLILKLKNPILERYLSQNNIVQLNFNFQDHSE